jgi:aspartate aminotransferase
MVGMAGGVPVRVDLAPHAFQLEPALDALAGAVTDDTQLVLLNSPANPSGAVFARAALAGLRDLAVDHDVLVVADEIYQAITYGGEYTSIGTLNGMADRTVTVNGFSKAYAMTGWRLGYYAGPPALLEQTGKLHSHSVSCATNFVQHAGVEALQNTDAAVADMVDQFEARRDLLVDLLADTGIEVPVPDGAFYLMLPVADDDPSWCEQAIDDAHVATVPGRAFGTPGYARLSYANGQDRLREAVERLDGAGLLGR